MKGMIFTADSILAIEAVVKTQTRRLIPLPGAPNNLGSWEPTTVGGPGCHDKRGRAVPPFTAVWHTRTGVTYVSPYVVDDLLYVKEAWQTGISLDGKSPEQIATASVDAGYRTPWAPINFVAGGSKRNAQLLRDFGNHWGRVRSPLHMPEWVSRFTLQVTEVRAQRVQEISDEDARAEGMDWAGPVFYDNRSHDDDREDPHVVGYPPAGGSFARDNYMRAWDSINGQRRRREQTKLGERGYPGMRMVVDESARWASNPFVFAYTFLIKERR